MDNIPDHLVPIIAGAFFLCTAIAGFCLYCCYFKHRNKAGRQTRNSDNRGCRVYGNSGQFPSYNLHNNPFLFYMGPAPRAFSEAPLTVEIESKRIPNSPCYLSEKHCNNNPTANAFVEVQVTTSHRRHHAICRSSQKSTKRTRKRKLRKNLKRLTFKSEFWTTCNFYIISKHYWAF